MKKIKCIFFVKTVLMNIFSEGSQEYLEIASKKEGFEKIIDLWFREEITVQIAVFSILNLMILCPHCSMPTDVDNPELTEREVLVSVRNYEIFRPYLAQCCEHMALSIIHRKDGPRPVNQFLIKTENMNNN